MNDLKVTLLQTNLHWENREANLSMLNKNIQSLTEPTDLILFPEMFTTGFSMNAASHAETMSGAAMDWMKQQAIQKNCVVCGSMMMKEDNAYYNRLIWMQPDGTYQFYDKRHLFRLAHEENTYTQGDRKMIMTIKGWKVLPLICYDLRFPVWSRRTPQHDYDLLIYVANWPERRVNAWDALLPARAVENQCYVAGLNRVGDDGNKIHHSGHSAVYDFLGEPLWKPEPDKESSTTISLNHDNLVKYRTQYPFGEDADNFTFAT